MIKLILFIFFQGASATYPSFSCDVKLADLKPNSRSDNEHNSNTSKCKQRSFEKMKVQLQSQIDDLGEEFEGLDNFSETVFKDERHDVERSFREKGKYHESVIGVVNSGVESMEYVLGGPLHNEIGIGNDVLDQLVDELSEKEMDPVCETIKTFLNTSKVAGGAGCTPGQHHGGKYNGKV